MLLLLNLFKKILNIGICSQAICSNLIKKTKIISLSNLYNNIYNIMKANNEIYHNYKNQSLDFVLLQSPQR
jgi:hypothetical protein